VTQKIIKGVQEIKKQKQKKIKLGNLDIQRDWGWAPEYVVAMNMMVKNEIPKDYIIATGKSISLREYAELVFKKAELDPKKFIVMDSSIKRKNEGKMCKVNPGLIEKDLGWKAKVKVEEAIDQMWEARTKKRRVRMGGEYDNIMKIDDQ
jgi:GDPmannose 4,6-dehydratase